MMRGRITPPSEKDPQPKRSRIDSEEDGDEGLKKPRREQEQELVKLVEEQRSELTQLEKHARIIAVQLDEARKNLAALEGQLVHAQNRSQSKSSAGVVKTATADNAVKVKSEPGVDTAFKEENGNATAAPSRRPLFVPASNIAPVPGARAGSNLKLVGDPSKASSGATSSRLPSTSATWSESDVSETSSKQPTASKITTVKLEPGSAPQKGPVPKTKGLEHKEHVDLITQIRGSKTPGFINTFLPNYVASQHKRKLRSLVINPATDEICATSALDGVISLWQIQGKGIGLTLLNTVDCLSPGQRRWSEDMTWDPSGQLLFACYSADGKDNQIAIINASRKKVKFLEDRPHERGIVNNIVFMPWYDEQPIFATGGSDHAIVMWGEKEGGVGWKPKLLHRSLHSSAVMGVAGMHYKQLVISAGADKRIIGFDPRYGRAEFRHQLDSKAMGVLPNPADFNLFMVQTG
eukprot:c24893_g1_i3 orf=405-1796(-)